MCAATKSRRKTNVRRAGFTLIELVIIIGIAASMVAISVLSVRQGQSAARLRGASRDIFALVRQARSIALVSEEPSIITYSTEEVDGEICARVTAVSSKKLKGDFVAKAQTLSGQSVTLSKTEDEEAGTGEQPSGLSVDDILFEPMSEDLLRGIRLKVVFSGQEEETASSGRKMRQNISVFSNVDYLLGKYGQAKKKAEEEKKDDLGEAGAVDNHRQEEVNVVWQVNGRCDPHRVWVYADGTEPEDGLVIEVDLFGSARILSADELEDR